MHITNELLASIFAESSAFCGREEVLHAVIYHQLKKAGHSHTRIAREADAHAGGFKVKLPSRKWGVPGYAAIRP